MVQDKARLILNGKINSRVFYRLEGLEDGSARLTVSGSGPMTDYAAIEEQPWAGQRDHISEVIIENGVTVTGENSFSDLTALRKVALPESVRIVGTFSFRNCISLPEIVFPEGVRNVGSKSFFCCASLERVYFPSTLETIDLRAFHECRAVSDVWYAGTRWQWEHFIVVDNSYSDNEYVLKARLHFGRVADAFADFDDITPETPYADAIDELYQHCLIEGRERKLDPRATATVRDLERILYIHDGADCQYGGMERWAEACLKLKKPAPEPVTLPILCNAILCLTRHNGYDAPEDDAVRWAKGKGYLAALSADMTETAGEALCRGCAAEDGANSLCRGGRPEDGGNSLCRGEMYAVLAAYLRSPESVADRYDQIVDAAKSAIAAGGDGRLHVIGVNLNKRGMAIKAGDCSLLVFPEGSTMLLDCGYMATEEKLLTFLRDVGVRDLDYLVFSHCHLDHTGNCLAVCRYIYEECGGRIGNFWYSGAEAQRFDIPAMTEYLAHRGLKREDILVDESGERERPVARMIDGVKITFFGPNRHDLKVAEEIGSEGSSNNTSLVMRMTHGKSVYFTGGDLYRNKEEYLLATYGPEEFRCTVAKANHHGNHTSSHPAWIDALSAQLVLAQTDGCGSSETRRRYMQKALYYATGFDGAVHIAMDAEGNFTYTVQYDSILRMNWPELRGEISVSQAAK